MKVMVFGSTGFIGRHLIKSLQLKGHTALERDVRRSANSGDTWENELLSCDAVINLGGAPIFGKRWNTKVKAEIYDSRIESTKKIADASGGTLKVFINASAVGYYGADPEETFTEEDSAGADFLAFVCRDWEEAAHRASAHRQVRTVIVRFGVVLGPDGGALEKLIPPFKAFVGGPIGFGKQWMSWVHVDDVVGILIYALENQNVSGVLNAVSPHPVRNKEFSADLGKALHRPSMLPLPGMALRLLIGEGADFLITGQKVLPSRTLAAGYVFKYPELQPALDDCV